MAADPEHPDHIHQIPLKREDELFPEKEKIQTLYFWFFVCLSLLNFTLAAREAMIVQRKNVLRVHVNEKDTRYSVQNAFLFQ